MIQRICHDFQISLDHSGDTQLPALVLLHAFPLSSAMWRAQLDFFSSRFQVLTPDARGIGDTNPFSAIPSIEQMARDLAALLDCFSIQTAIIGGCSMGGYVSLEFARQFPERLRGLILCDTRADPDSDEGRNAREEMILFARQNDGTAVADKMLPKLLCDQTRQHKPEVVEQVRALARPLSGDHIAQLVQSLRDRRDSTPILSSIQVPTLVIGGRDDIPAPVFVMAQMAAQIPNSKHVVLENAGHLSNLEQPATWNREVQQWLTESDL
ncbi:3-oxoadipate enol-lactonase 2 [Abditibacteriota bacterium]|nr:3-oxoadipate enol-lactonase 2 [Abditibacteriota bacterium]